MNDVFYPITHPATPADVGGNVLAKCEAAMMVRLLMSQGGLSEFSGEGGQLNLPLGHTRLSKNYATKHVLSGSGERENRHG